MYKAVVTKLQNLRPHNNADRLQIATLYGSQVIVGLDNYEGQLGVYFPSDGQIMSEFLSNNNLYTNSELNKDTGKKGYFGDKGRVRAQKFRGEKSDGMWLPISCLDFLGDIKIPDEGEQFDTLGGVKICQKYINPETLRKRTGNNIKKKIKKSYPMFKEHLSTSQFMYNKHKIQKGDLITISLKCHGTSQRSTFCKETNTLTFWQKIINKVTGYYNNKWGYLTGTRRVVLERFDDPKKLGFYGHHTFRKIHHDKFINNLHKGETIYYEVVGWEDIDRPIMGKCNNKKTKDKEFIKKYGEETIFKYGCLNGTSDIYVYRITMTNEDGYTIEYSDKMMRARCSELNLKPVPLLKQFIYDGNEGELTNLVEELCQGEDLIDPSHIREGVCIRIENGLDFYVLKHKNFFFKLLEGIIKDTGQVDIEEAEGVTDAD